ncbi:MAG: HDOD domain-containing protein [Bdellovibrionales bacterium]|nr:HDOD domain-containing protein [Bdellovibrionales bacterium]
MADEQVNSNELRFIPVDRDICESLLEIVGDQSVRVDRLNELVCSDPVLLLEIVAAANGLKNVAGGKAVLEGKAALLALGLERIRGIVQELAEVTPHYSGDREFWLKAIKQKCKKSAAVASLIAKTVKPESTLECFTIGSFSFWGDLIALSKLGERFVAVMEEGLRRSKLRYRLAKDFNFSLEEESIDYLRKRTLPNAIPLCLDPESSKLLGNVQIMKAITLSAIEFVDAFLEERLDRLAPNVSIPPKSYRRMLALSDARYEALYEAIVAYLEKGEFVEELVPEEAPAEESIISTDGELEDAPSELEELIAEEREEEQAELSFVEAFETAEVQDAPAPGDIVEFKEDYARPIETVARRKYVSKSDQAMPKFVSMFEDTETVEDLLQRLLDMLITQPPFECAALLVVAPELRKAKPVMIRGREINESSTSIIELKDPLSPLLNAKSKVVSYSPKKKGDTPFGCGNYALAPLEIDHPRPVLLYADCGEGNILTFEGRRLFRKVIDLLNNVLPNMEGAIPVAFEEAVPEEKNPPS